MTGTSKSDEGWGVAGSSKTYGGVRAFAVSCAVRLWQAVSLSWLRVRWKNEPEALSELRRLVREHQSVGYAEWVETIGSQKRLEFTAASGTWYQAVVEPVWDDK